MNHALGWTPNTTPEADEPRREGLSPAESLVVERVLRREGGPALLARLLLRHAPALVEAELGHWGQVLVAREDAEELRRLLGELEPGEGAAHYVLTEARRIVAKAVGPVVEES